MLDFVSRPLTFELTAPKLKPHVLLLNRRIQAMQFLQVGNFFGPSSSQVLKIKQRTSAS